MCIKVDLTIFPIFLAYKEYPEVFYCNKVSDFIKIGVLRIAYF